MKAIQGIKYPNMSITFKWKNCLPFATKSHPSYPMSMDWNLGTI